MNCPACNRGPSNYTNQRLGVVRNAVLSFDPDTTHTARRNAATRGDYYSIYADLSRRIKVAIRSLRRKVRRHGRWLRRRRGGRRRRRPGRSPADWHDRTLGVRRREVIAGAQRARWMARRGSPAVGAGCRTGVTDTVNPGVDNRLYSTRRHQHSLPPGDDRRPCQTFYIVVAVPDFTTGKTIRGGERREEGQPPWSSNPKSKTIHNCMNNIPGVVRHTR